MCHHVKIIFIDAVMGWRMLWDAYEISDAICYVIYSMYVYPLLREIILLDKNVVLCIKS